VRTPSRPAWTPVSTSRLLRTCVRLLLSGRTRHARPKRHCSTSTRSSRLRGLRAAVRHRHVPDEDAQLLQAVGLEPRALIARHVGEVEVVVSASKTCGNEVAQLLGLQGRRRTQGLRSERGVDELPPQEVVEELERAPSCGDSGSGSPRALLGAAFGVVLAAAEFSEPVCARLGEKRPGRPDLVDLRCDPDLLMRHEDGVKANMLRGCVRLCGRAQEGREQLVEAAGSSLVSAPAEVAHGARWENVLSSESRCPHSA